MYNKLFVSEYFKLFVTVFRNDQQTKKNVVSRC